MTKVSNEIRLRIARESKSDVWKLHELMNVIKDEVEAHETREGARLAHLNLQYPTTIEKTQGIAIFLVLVH